MRHDNGFLSGWLRALVLAVLSALGLIAIVGSGGGYFGLPSDCPPGWDCNTPGPPPPPAASVQPSYITALVGTTVTYSAETFNASGNVTYQWNRSSDGGATYVALAGATDRTYSLASVNLGDDGAMFQVVVRADNGIGQAASHLAVSSTPGVVFEDGEFLAGDWSVAPAVDPTQPVPAHSEVRATTGGNPDAFREMTHQMSQGPSSLRVFHSSLTATYDPPSQGAIYVIDYAEDCIALSSTTPGFLMDSGLLIEQSGRRYLAARTDYCQPPTWSTTLRSSLRAKDFVLFDGPACGAAEACPDFAASAAPLRFGYVRHSTLSFGAAGSIEHGIDNWKVTVWRR